MKEGFVYRRDRRYVRSGDKRDLATEEHGQWCKCGKCITFDELFGRKSDRGGIAYGAVIQNNRVEILKKKPR
jgi:hypothetical protein